MEQKLKEVISKLDEGLMKLAFQAKLNGMGNTWIYHEMERKISEAPKEVQALAKQWLDSRWGDYKLF